jgi:hypothetical protein
MRTLILTLMTMVTSAISAQNILDSIQLYDYPVKEGVIYKYDNKCFSAQLCAPSLSIISVITDNDSVFHFEEGKVAGVFTVDDYYAITIENGKNEYITYSNLDGVSLKKGDRVIKGMCIGTSGDSNDHGGRDKQVDILVLRQVKRLPYSKALAYIRSKSSLKKNSYPTL